MVCGVICFFTHEEKEKQFVSACPEVGSGRGTKSGPAEPGVDVVVSHVWAFQLNRDSADPKSKANAGTDAVDSGVSGSVEMSDTEEVFRSKISSTYMWPPSQQFPALVSPVRLREAVGGGEVRIWWRVWEEGSHRWVSGIVAVIVAVTITEQ